VSVWLLSHLVDSPGNRLVTAEGQARGYSVVLVRPASLGWACGANECHLLGHPRPRLVFARLGSSAPECDLYPVRVLEAAGIPVLNRYNALRLCRDKAQTYLQLKMAGVPFPDTMWLAGSWTREQVEEHCGPPPHIVKLASGSQGQGVVLSESWRSLSSLVEAFRALGAPVLVQRFLAEAAGRDTRVLVIGGKARGAALRQAQSPGEFRSNLHLGGAARVVEPTPRQVQVAEAAVACLGLDVAGVDLLESQAGPVVVEVNGSPGYEASPFFVKHLWDHLETAYLQSRP
jgi:ribosomal protein S6--L-glutamate ligase